MHPVEGSCEPLEAVASPSSVRPNRPDEDARALYAALHRGLSLLGPDETVVFGVLAERAPEQLAVVLRRYEEHFGEALDQRLKRELSPADLRRARALLEGDRVQRFVERLRLATIAPFGRNTKALVTALVAVPPKLLDDVCHRFASSFGPLEVAVRRSVTGPVRDGALALLRGDRSTALALWGADFAASF